MTTLDIELKKQGLVFDRTVTDNFKLPHTLEEIKIQPNELAVAKTFNLKLNKLYDNLVYLYGLCNVANFNIPKTYEGWFGYAFGAQTLYFYPGNYSTLFADSILSSAFYRSTQATSFYSTISPYSHNILFTSNEFISLYSLDEGYNPIVVIEQTNIDPLSGSICFSKIGSVTTCKDEILFVSDTLYNNIYSYKLKDAVGDDYIKSRKLFLQYSIGGTGTSKDKIKFSYIGKILFANDRLIVEDAGNKCFKVFDKNLNWVNTSVVTTFFNTVSSINCMAYSTVDNDLYVCDNKTLYVFDIDTEFKIQLKNLYNLTETVGDSKILDIKFAHYDPNVFYILTETKLIKKWITKPNKNIGILAPANTNIFGTDIFKWFTVTPTKNNDRDIIVASLVSQNNLINYGAVFTDNLNLISLFKTDQEISYYSRDDIKINPNEYNASWVYNKSIKKLLYNMSLFVNNIGYRYFSGEENDTPSYIYRGYNSFFRNNVVLDTNTFSNVYINENFQGETINRCFEQIYNYQSLILTEIINNQPVYVDLSPRTVGGFQYQFYTGGYSQ